MMLMLLLLLLLLCYYYSFSVVVVVFDDDILGGFRGCLLCRAVAWRGKNNRLLSRLPLEAELSFEGLQTSSSPLMVV